MASDPPQVVYIGHTMRRKIPSLQALACFDAAARHESRGAHSVDDYSDSPEHPNGRNDAEWHKHTLWYSEGNRLSYKPVQMKPLTVDSVELKVRTF